MDIVRTEQSMFRALRNTREKDKVEELIGLTSCDLVSFLLVLIKFNTVFNNG